MLKNNAFKLFFSYWTPRLSRKGPIYIYAWPSVRQPEGSVAWNPLSSLFFFFFFFF